MKEKINAAVAKDPTRQLRSVYQEVVSEMPANDVTVPQFYNIQSSLKRFRASCMPPLPDDVYSVAIEGTWAETWANERFLSKIDNNWGIAIFATRKNLKRLSKCKTIFIDGTFKSCPRPYSQFITIHGMYHGRVLPLAMCLASGKTVAHYRQFVKHIYRQVYTVTHQHLAPRTVICDFEMALITALRTELPDTNVRGCYFHFCQALWRKIQALGLATAYKQSENCKNACGNAWH